MMFRHLYKIHIDLPQIISATATRSGELFQEKEMFPKLSCFSRNH